MNKQGRKSLREEIRIIERLSALSEPTFKYIAAMYDAGDKADKKWAVEQMMKLYAKCIPQEIVGDSDNPIFISGINYVIPNATPAPTDNSEANVEATPGVPSA